MTSSSINKLYFNSQYTFKSEVFSAEWLSEVRNPKSLIYADVVSTSHVLVSYGMISPDDSATLSKDTRNYYGDTYVYLRRLNIVDGLIQTTGTSYFNTSEITPVLNNINLIYSNGESDIYRPVGK